MQKLYTKKIYYQIYTHRLSICCDNPTGRTNDPLAPNQQVITWLLNNKFGPKAYKGLASYSYVYNKHSYTVFFKDQAILEYLQQYIPEKYYLQLESPMDEEHVALLESNDKLVTRKQLFYGKYRVVLRVSPTKLTAWQVSTENINEIKAWCRNQFDLQRSDANDRFMMSGWTKGNFYFADPKDALLFKLTWGGQDVKTERVVLYSELTKEEAQ